ncbi:MAG: archease [Nitrosomonas sp.]|nr:archease [Nitrosomonas sp.]MCW5608996.1 archease [Nitrosomonas sp.]
MRFSYFEHDADVGVIGHGKTVEQAFEAAAQAVFAIMTNLDTVQVRDEITVAFEEADLEFALVIWINLILDKAREWGMVFNVFHLQRNGQQWFARIDGEKWRDALERRIEVKGATFTMLSVRQVKGIWVARCVVDV